MERDNVYDLSSKIAGEELTQEQKDHWWQVLEDCERGAEYARRVLKIGEFATKKGNE